MIVCAICSTMSGATPSEGSSSSTTSQRVRTEALSRSKRLSLPAAKNPMARPSGDQNGNVAPLVVQYLREQYKERGQTPNFRTMLKDIADLMPGCDSKALYDLFPLGPAKQGARVAGLPKPFGKGGY